MENLRIHITGDQAIKLMRAARQGDLVTAATAPETTPSAIPSSVRSLADLGLDSLLEWLNISPSNPLKLLVPSVGDRNWLTGIHTSSLSANLPVGSFLELHDGHGNPRIHIPPDVRVLVDAPPLALVRSAHLLSAKGPKTKKDELVMKLRLIEFACECCGSYARDPLKPRSGRGHFDKPGDCGRFVTPDDLLAYVLQATGVHGRSLARLAASHAIDESGSPMETYLNLALTLPPRLGGLSMEKPLANKQLRVDKSVRMLRHDSLRPDFQWPERRTVAEYLGDAEHASKHARIEDKNRLQDYVSAGYRPFFLMFDDVRSVAALNDTAEMLAGEFAKRGKRGEPYRIRRRIREEGFCERQVALVSTLLPPMLRFDES